MSCIHAALAFTRPDLPVVLAEATRVRLFDVGLMNVTVLDQYAELPNADVFGPGRTAGEYRKQASSSLCSNVHNFSGASSHGGASSSMYTGSEREQVVRVPSACHCAALHTAGASQRSPPLQSTSTTMSEAELLGPDSDVKQRRMKERAVICFTVRYPWSAKRNECAFN